jgi:hypothetical protein
MYDGFTSPLLRSFMTALTVTAGNVTKTYDGLAGVATGLTYSTTPNANLLGTLNWGGVTNVGNYAASGLYSNQQGYIISYVNSALTINKAHLTVTADNQTRLYGAANPTLTQTISGFVIGQNLASSGVTGTATGTTTATASTAAGSAAIAASTTGLSASNYDFAASRTDGVLTITASATNGLPLAVTQALAGLPGGANPNRVEEFKNAVVSATQSTSAASNGNASAAPPLAPPAPSETRVADASSTGNTARGRASTIQYGSIAVQNGGLDTPADSASQE